MNAPSAVKFEEKASLPKWPKRVQKRRPKGAQDEKVIEVGLVIIVATIVAVILLTTALFLGLLPVPGPAESEQLWRYTL